MVVGVGIDIIEIDRFDINGNPKLLKKLYTEREIDYIKSGGAQSAAGLFAAKEAVVKALGTGFKGFWPSAVEILHDQSGRPYACLSGKAGELARAVRAERISISITHNKTTASAVAVAEGPEASDAR